MTPDQEMALEALYEKYEVVAVASLPDGRASVEVGNGQTPYLFVSENGEVEDEDGYGVAL